MRGNEAPRAQVSVAHDHKTSSYSGNESLHSQLGYTIVLFESFQIEFGNDAALAVSLNHSLVSGAVGISPRTTWAWNNLLGKTKGLTATAYSQRNDLSSFISLLGA